ncbi:MAG: DNA polymerase III subunit beta [Candidatus Handelsmanbacteria bacterium RIFCSPLOWO2_12_FULL_64_10]|uniref:DNA polymerase III subunit beta n=1 Tax=Handelsmanbacteria sp. (strain RIFCSPLOWO2_12_FULL_64_10) TaxID=1817868 RepID=A0A1F6CDU0_HANXR|nr:MAG: DNA polymerase III subunit beta [Candidatus Handelsmanbacteria bacterium RIFCSPLOWO2_12_FULL_64_10]
MILVTETLLREMTEAIVEAVNPQRIVLFGSHARDQAGPDSDLDLLVVEDHPFGPDRSRRQEMARIRKALSSFRIPKDILVYSADEVEKWRNSLNHVVSHSLREGKLLYERS